MAWKDFLNHPSAKNSPLVATIMRTSSYTLNGNMIQMHLANSLQESQLPKLLPPLLKHLRDALSNDLIDIKAAVKIDGNAQSKRMYTDEDKLKFLEQEYPALKELREKLGLVLG